MDTNVFLARFAPDRKFIPQIPSETVSWGAPPALHKYSTLSSLFQSLMSRLALSTVSVGFLLVVLISSSTIISVRASPTYTPGVSAGQWAKYKTLYDRCTSSDPTTCTSASSMNDTDYGLLRVLTVAGSSITLQLVTVYKNGTSGREGVLLDVASGASNVTNGGGSPGDYFVLAGGLSGATHDPIWAAPSAPTLNATRSESALGHTRNVNFLNYSSSFSAGPYSFSTNAGFTFDALSGVFIEVSFSFSSNLAGSTDEQFAIGMVDNNIWLTSLLPDYSLSASPTTVSVSGVGTGTTTISPTRSAGFNANIALTATPSSSALSCSLSSKTLSLSGSDSSTLSCSGSPGNYVVDVAGNGSFVTHAIGVNVNVAAVTSPDFTMSSSGGISFQTGASGSATITISGQYGYSSTASLELSVPSGISCGLDKTSVTGSGSVTLTCSGQPGTYTVTLTATAGGVSHSTQTTVTVSAAAAPQPASSSSLYIVLGGIVAAAIVAVLAVILLRRRPRAGISPK